MKLITKIKAKRIKPIIYVKEKLKKLIVYIPQKNRQSNKPLFGVIWQTKQRNENETLERKREKRERKNAIVKRGKESDSEKRKREGK